MTTKIKKMSTTIGEDLSNAASKTATVVSKKAGELSDSAKNSKAGQTISDSVHQAAKSTVTAVDELSATETAKSIAETGKSAANAVSTKANEVGAAAQKKVDELRKE